MAGVTPDRVRAPGAHGAAAADAVGLPASGPSGKVTGVFLPLDGGRTPIRGGG
ncbi:hypothetical protein [Streptomyces sp. NPDC005877]|uniref:hypothetical protein n=1 Tax=Streptomyces sp. NPDC005877 TaxID=3155346 RepID=UPI0033D4FBE3